MTSQSRIQTESEKTRVIYFGTPEYAVPSFRALMSDHRFDVALAVTQPDRPVGRKRVITPTPVKAAALDLGVDVFQPETLREAATRQVLIDIEPDLFVVAAYGLILGAKSLAVPRIGALNLHASLLPRYRGASPISAAIECGDAETGVTLMQMDQGIDTGAIVSMMRLNIEPDDTTHSLTGRLAELAADLVIRDLGAYLHGRLLPVPQPESGTSHTRMLTKADGWIDWTQSAIDIERQVRAMWNWPRTWTTVNERSLQVHRATVKNIISDAHPGEVDTSTGWPLVTCGVGTLRLDLVQPEGGKQIPGSNWISGLRERVTVLGEAGAPGPLPPRTVEI